jgi:2,4-dichlorophenol 6-monooxygenase
MAHIIDIPVIVVGGGSCGLTTSCFLSDFGVEHVLFERHATTSVLLKAHYLNQHKMSDKIVAKGAPLKNFSHVAWATSLGGEDALDRRIIHKFACFGGDDGSPRAEWYKYVLENVQLECFELARLRKQY